MFVVVGELSNVFVVELIIGKLDEVDDELEDVIKLGIEESSFESGVVLELVLEQEVVLLVVKLGVEETSFVLVVVLVVVVEISFEIVVELKLAVKVEDELVAVVVFESNRSGPHLSKLKEIESIEIDA